MTKISIIVPCYNQQEYIAECLDSILAQTFNEWEAIVINDGSKDNSLQLIQKYADKDSRIKIINQENQGVVRARNNAIKQAKGKFIYPLDGDDIIVPSCLEILYNKITSTKNRVVASEVKTFGKYNYFFKQPKFNKLEMYGRHECCVISALFYKEDFDKFGGYKEEFNDYGGDDMDYWLNYIDNSMPMLRLPDILFLYRTKEDHESKWKNFSIEEFKKRRLFKNKLLFKNHPNMEFYIFLYYIREKIFYNQERTDEKIKLINKTKGSNGRRRIYFCGIKIFSYKQRQ